MQEDTLCLSNYTTTHSHPTNFLFQTKDPGAQWTYSPLSIPLPQIEYPKTRKAYIILEDPQGLQGPLVNPDAEASRPWW